MSVVVNIHEAKTHLSRLVEQAAAGEEIILAKAGKPVARLAPPTPAKRRIKFGTLKGKITVPEDFDAPLPDEVLSLFQGRE